jgi:hypothetical protein
MLGTYSTCLHNRRHSVYSRIPGGSLWIDIFSLTLDLLTREQPPALRARTQRTQNWFACFLSAVFSYNVGIKSPLLGGSALKGSTRSYVSHRLAPDSESSLSNFHGSKPEAPWPESASSLYRPSHRRLSVKLMWIFSDRGSRVVSATEPRGRILGFIDRRRYCFLQVAPQLHSRGWVDPVTDPLLLRKSRSAGNRTRASGPVARNSDHRGDHFHGTLNANTRA